MTWTPLLATEWILIALCCFSTCYITLVALVRHGSPPRYANGVRDVTPRPVSVLKPLCGFEPRLYANLATFCDQTHPCFQLIFGVSSNLDPAVAVVARLHAAYPHVDITLVVDPSLHGTNHKVSNLINMEQSARNEVIVVADSDIAVKPDYLVNVIAPLEQKDVGIVTCLYRARRVGNFWSRLGALFIDEWFAPSVYLAHATGSQRFGFGATLAMRRETLDSIGGLTVVKNCIADDYSIAHEVRKLGLGTYLSEVVVSTDVTERDFRSLWQREKRWLRTIRLVHPLGFAFILISFASPWLLASFILGLGYDESTGTRAASVADMLLDLSTSFGVSARILLHWRRARDWRVFLRDLPLIPLRDLLLWAEWAVAAFGSHVVWRGSRIRIDDDLEGKTQPDGPEAFDRTWHPDARSCMKTLRPDAPITGDGNLPH
ncbi:bacteriohopanetetrol glucosamine biosynthesis glycosyltransferase HpnI [Caballeronia sp. 15715]|uniref:bacteriohopanetetrol glucosamine biosynthesis glycosyltransferase HpnI n=1 Tax=unclassified Caballeronia TaxID=2646786 RepID=UPI0039E41E4B